MASATDTPAVRSDKPVVEVATTVSPEAKINAAQAVLPEGGVEVTEVLSDRRAETNALVQGTSSLPETEDTKEHLHCQKQKILMTLMLNLLRQV